MTEEKTIAQCWAAASFHTGWEAEEIQKVRANVRALLGPKSECVVSSTVESGDVLSPDERAYRTVSWTNRTLIVHGRPARYNSWFSSHEKIAGGTISLQQTDFAHGSAVEAVCEQVLLRLRKRLEEILTFGMPRPLEREWAELVAAQLTTWEAEDSAVIAAAHATWAEEDRLATEADELKTRAEQFSRSPAGNEVGEAPTGFDSWHRPIEELQELVAGLRTWLAEAEQRRLTILSQRRETEIAAGLAKAERLAAIAAAMAGPATPAPWFIGGSVDVEAIEASTGRKRGEGLGDKLAGAHETRYLPGDRSLLALRISSAGGSRYYCKVTTKGLDPLAGVSILEEVYGRRDQQLLALIAHENWYVVEQFFKDGSTTHYAVTNRHGTAVLYPDSEGVRSRGWNGEEVGPSEAEVRKILGLAPRATAAVEESPPPAPTLKPVEPPKPATPAAVAATLVSLQGKFGKKR